MMNPKKKLQNIYNSEKI